MELMRLLKHRPWSFVGILILLAVVLGSFVIPLITGYAWNEISIAARLTPPGGEHILGADNVGRDILTRMSYGAQSFVWAGIVAVSISAIVGIALGWVGSISEGAVNNIIKICVFGVSALVGISVVVVSLLWIIEYLNGVASVTAAVVNGQPPAATTLFTRNITSLLIKSSIQFSIIVTGVMVSLLFISSFYRIAWTVVMSSPGMRLKTFWRKFIPTALVNLGMATGISVLVMSVTSYYGIGISPPYPSWGGMLSGAGRQFMMVAPWMWKSPFYAMVVMVTGLLLFGSATLGIWIPSFSEPKLD